MRLNMACGDEKFPGFVNIDINPAMKPDLVANIATTLPFKKESIDVVTMFHVIEHIREAEHRNVLAEIYRILKPNGLLLVSYPEFGQVAQLYLTNYQGNRDFWKNTIFGRQLNRYDYHVSLMDSHFFTILLRECGFKDVEAQREAEATYNTVVRARKKVRPVITAEENLRRSIEDARYSFVEREPRNSSQINL